MRHLLRGALPALAAAAVVLASAAAAVADPATITATEGQALSGELGRFSEPCPVDPETHVFLCDQLDPTATIDWGDSQSSPATLTRLPVQTVTGPKPCLGNFPSCTFTVDGTHIYSGANTYTGTVTWTDADATAPNPPAQGTIPFTAQVNDAAIALAGVSVTRHGQAATLTGTLSDENPLSNPCNFQATVDWGDGQTSAATIGDGCQLQAPARGRTPDATATATFPVTATHTYTDEPGTDAALTVQDFGGSTARVTAAVPSPAIVTTGQASSVGQSTATVEGNVDPQGAPVRDCHFEWGTTAGYGQTAPCSPAAFSGPQAVSAALSGLTPGTTYHFAVVATTDVGTYRGLDGTFTTLAPVASGAPTVSTGAADALTVSTATVHGSVNPNGHTLVDCHFELGTTTAYDRSVSCSPSTASGTSAVAVRAAVNGLTPDTTYHFRLVAANAGAGPSRGADGTFTTLPTCDVQPAFGYVQAKGCFARTGATYVSTPGTLVSLNGLTLTPDAASTRITLDPGKRQVTASGAVTVSASEVPLYDGKFRWTEPLPDGIDPVKIGTLSPPSSAAIAGLPFEGDLSLSFNRNHGADLAGNVQLPFGTVLGALGINGTVQLHTALGIGLQHDQLKVEKDNLTIGGVGVKNLSVTYSPTDDIWEGGAQIVLPTSNQLTVGADLAFQHGRFHRFAGSVDNINVPIADGVYVQRISVVFGVNPTTIGGGLGLSFGPEVDGKTLVRVDGNFLYQAPSGQTAGHIHVDGSLTLMAFRTASAYLDYFTSGLVRFGAHVRLGLPDASAQDPSKEPVYIDAGLDGAVYTSRFDVDVNAQVALNFIDLNIGAEVLVSDKGLAACAHLSAFGFGWSPGVGYTWANHDLELMSHGCSVGPWKTLDLGAVPSAAGGSRPVRLPAGRALLELRGTAGPPKVTVSGPRGQAITVPATSTRPLLARGFMVLQDSTDRITYVAVQHGGGTWRVTPEPGSSPIASVRAAGLLPQPHVTARVSGSGRRRTLAWRLRPIPGQRVVFWERGRDVGHVIGSTSTARGRLRFRLANGAAGRRTIEAQVISYGLPRTRIAVARFTAPRALRPARVRGLRGTPAPGGAVRLSWRPAARAQQYVIEVDTKDGARLVEFAGRRSRGIVVRNVVPITAARIRVAGELATGVAGPAAVARFSARPSGHRGHRHRRHR